MEDWGGPKVKGQLRGQSRVCGSEETGLQDIRVDKRALFSPGQGVRQLRGGCGLDQNPGVDLKERTGS